MSASRSGRAAGTIPAGTPSGDNRMSLVERKYEIAICSLCGSDNIFSTEHDSWCDGCHEWMSAEVAVVVPEAASSGAVEALQKIAVAGYAQANGRWRTYSHSDLRQIAKDVLLKRGR
jgi:CDGSH-type Zn-finger protein